MDMEEENSVENMNSLLFQLALETQDLSKSKDEIDQQVGEVKLNVAEKKTLIQDIKTSIKKLEEAMTQKENLVRCLKENTISLKVTNNLLVEYEKTLQAELERKREVSNQDAKMYQERIQRYKKVFEQHKARYCENPLVRKLIQAETEKEEIEQRITVWEEEIVVKERELQSLQGNIPDLSKSDASESDSVHQSTEEPQEKVDPQTEEGAIAQTETSISSDLIDPQQLQLAPSSPWALLSVSYEDSSLVADEENDGGEEEEELVEMAEYQVEDTPGEESASFSSPVDTDQSITWEDLVAGGQLEGLSPEQTAEAEAQEESFEEKFGAVGGVELEFDEDMQESLLLSDEREYEAEDYLPIPPTRMQAMQRSPTRSLNSNSSGYECMSPKFTFAMSASPATPAPSVFDCDFDQDLFSFSSPFLDKMSSQPKSPGFLMDQMEGRLEDDFQLFFLKSPTQVSGGQEQGGGDEEDFPFFNFGGEI